MKKILINTPSLKLLGGVSNHYLGLQNKWSLDVRYNTIARRNNIPTFILLPYDLVKFLFKCLFLKPDLVVLNPSLMMNALRRDALFLWFAKFLKIKTVVFFHGWDLEVQKEIDNKKYNFYKNYSSADLILVLADEFKQKLIKWGFKSPIKLTTTKVDDDIISSFDVKNKEYNKNILFLSRVEESKGIFIVLESFKQVVLQYPKVKLTIAGDGTALQAAKDYVKNEKINNIKFLGRVSGDKLINTFKEHSIYFFPTYYGEGMPTSLLEAMGFGHVIITRPVGGIKDFFTNEMGYITESLNPDDFYKILKGCLNSGVIKEKGEYNSEYVKKYFVASRVVKSLEKYFEEI